MARSSSSMDQPKPSGKYLGCGHEKVGIVPSESIRALMSHASCYPRSPEQRAPARGNTLVGRMGGGGVEETPTAKASADEHRVIPAVRCEMNGVIEQCVERQIPRHRSRSLHRHHRLMRDTLQTKASNTTGSSAQPPPTCSYLLCGGDAQIRLRSTSHHPCERSLAMDTSVRQEALQTGVMDQLYHRHVPYQPHWRRNRELKVVVLYRLRLCQRTTPTTCCVLALVGTIHHLRTDCRHSQRPRASKPQLSRG